MRRNQTSSVRLLLRVAACLTIGVLLAGCGDDDSSSNADASTTTTDSAQAVCSDQQALQSSLDDLTNLDITSAGADGLESALNDVKDNLSALQDSVSSSLQPQVQALRDSLDDLDSAVSDLGSNGSAASVLTAVSDVASAAATLLGSLDDGACS